MRFNLLILAFLFPILLWSQEPEPIQIKKHKTDSLSVLFIGDIMGHDSQINAAYDPETDTYNFDSYFTHLKDIIDDADLTIANLEVTLAGPPFKGYPQFSSPDVLAHAVKNAGIDVLITANNHSFDRGEKGVTRTIDVLDILGIMHTGTFQDSTDRQKNHPLIVTKNNIKLALLNYTYSTNGLSVSGPSSVNYINREKIKEDILYSKSLNADQIIVLFHWGKEYQSQPEPDQEKLFNYCKSLGANIVIGSHPHVLQKMEWNREDKPESFVAYSLGNFVSNQRTRKRDGGAMVKLSLLKTDSVMSISGAGYYLTWVHKHLINQEYQFTVVPASKFEKQLPEPFRSNDEVKKQIFLRDSRELLNKENLNTGEFIFDDSLKIWDIPNPDHLYFPDSSDQKNDFRE